MTEVRAFPSRPESVTAARRFVVSLMHGLPSTIVDSVALAVSELATNCLRHAGTPFTISVDRDRDSLRIAVHDRGPGAPSVRSPGFAESSGRGLRIVERLASDWGVVGAPYADGGKTVWFSVRLPSLPLERTRG